MQKKIIESNLLIARFLGYETYDANGYTNVIYSDDNHRTHVDLHYHHDWNWLMPVIEKIEEETSWELVMYSNDCFWNSFGDRPEGLESSFSGYRRKATYEAVVEFIKWYNKQN